MNTMLRLWADPSFLAIIGEPPAQAKVLPGRHSAKVLPGRRSAAIAATSQSITAVLDEIAQTNGDVDHTSPMVPDDFRETDQGFASTDNDESRYRGNLSSIAKDLQQVLNDTPPDKASATIHGKIKTVHSLMTEDEDRGDFESANLQLDELPGLLTDYHSAVTAHNQAVAQQQAAAQKKAADDAAQASYHAQLAPIQHELDQVLKENPTDPNANAIFQEITRAHSDMNAAVFEANFAKANVHLASISAALPRYRAAKAAAANVAAKPVYDAKLKAISDELTKATTGPVSPTDPFPQDRQQIVDVKTRMNATAASGDYTTAVKLVDDLKLKLDARKQKLADHEKSEKARKEQAAKDASTPPAPPAPPEPSFEALIKEAKDLLEDPTPMHANDSTSLGILAQLKKEIPLAELDKGRLGYGFEQRSPHVAEVKRLIKDYPAASQAGWKRVLDIEMPGVIKDQLSLALDESLWTDAMMKAEHAKVLAKKQQLDAVVAKGDYYTAATVTFVALREQVYRFVSLVQKVPGDKGGVVYLRPRPLGPAVGGPQENILLMLLEKTGRGPTDDPPGVKLNTDGAALLAEWARHAQQEQDWEKKMELVKQNAGKGAEDLKQVEGVTKAIAAGTHGQGGAYLRGVIEDYGKAVVDAEKALRQIPIKLKVVDIAIDEMHTAILEQAKLDKERAVKNAQSHVQDEQKRIDDRKNEIRNYFSIALSVVKPEKWTTIIAAGVAVVGEVIVEQNLSKGRLATLQQQLTEAEKALTDVQDEIALGKIATSGLNFQKSQAEVDDARKSFLDAVGIVQNKETTVVEAMKTNPVTASAAKLVEKRGKIFKAANDAEASINKYLADTANFPATIAHLANQYDAYGAIVKARGNDAYLQWLAGTSKTNVDTLVGFKPWIEGVQAHAHTDLQYLAKTGGDTYFAGYDKIPDALRAAVANRND